MKFDDKEKPAPPLGGAAGFFYTLRTQFGKFLCVNLLFILFSLPLFTLPAALCAMNRVLVKLVRDGYVLVWLEFRDEFKTELWKALPVGLLFLAMLGAAYYLLSLSLSNAASVYGMLFGALGLTLLFAAVILSAYTFVLLPMLALKSGQILKNAYKLAMLSAGRSLGALGVRALMAAILWLFFPLSILLLPLGWFALTWFALCALINPTVQQYVIAPYEAQQKSAEEAPAERFT